MVLATTYFRDGVRVAPALTMVSGDWQKFIPGARSGAIVASDYNPGSADRPVVKARV